MNGFINVLKPPGMTSAAVVSVVKRLSGEARIGHAGTLDPEASGVLPIMLGRATRLFDYLVDKEKTYMAECAFGSATDTQDATGHVIATGTDYPDLAKLRAAADQLTGDIWQRPGMYSAIKQDGKPMYQRARKGEVVEVPKRLVHVERILLQEETPEHGILMTVDCGRGTYIRSICEDLGTLVGCPAHMRFLLRAKSGIFDLATACTVEELTNAAENGRLQELVLPLDMPLGHIPMLNAPKNLAKLVQNGAKLPAAKLPGAEKTEENKPLRIYLEDHFWGIAVRQGDILTWRALIPPEG